MGDVRRRECGASFVEWGATLLLIAAVVGVLIAAIPGPVTTGVRSAVCRAFGTQCAAGQTAQAGPQPPAPQRGRSGYPPQRRQQAPPTGIQTATERVLNETPLGRDALDWARRNGVTIRYQRGGGSYYDDTANRITVDSDRTAEQRAATVVHEVNHARNRNAPDARSMTRAQYINAALDEEVNGTVLAIVANRQLQQARARNRPPDVALQPQYDAAYRRAIQLENARRRRAGRPTLSATEAQRVGEAAGRLRVRQAFQNGEVNTSTTGETYPQFYGRSWDVQNPGSRNGTPNRTGTTSNDCFLWIFC
jgi:hypothetical protein